jgi:hypothetical protein
METGLPEWSVSSDPLVSIGGPDPREDYQLFDVKDATVLDDGRVVVANRGSEEIRFYSEAGVHLRTVGGPGEGPGEFRQIFEVLRLPGDTLLITANRPGFTWLNPEGEYLRSQPNTVIGFHPPCESHRWPAPVLPDGRYLFVWEQNPGIAACPPLPDGHWLKDAVVTLYNPTDRTSDTLGRFPGTERYGPFYLPNGRLLVSAISSDKIFIGSTGGESVSVFDHDGQPVTTLSVPFAPAPVPNPEERIQEQSPMPGRGMVRFEIPYPDSFPRFGRFLADEEGFLWFMGYPPVKDLAASTDYLKLREGSRVSPGTDWRVTDLNDRTVAKVKIPDGFFPFEIGDHYLLGMIRDEYDVISVQVYGLDRSGVLVNDR